MDFNPAILVVDDDPEMAVVLAELLRQHGYSVQAVASAAETEEAVSRLPHLRLVFLDLVMPGVDGMTLLERLKQQRPELAVMMMSGVGTMASAVEAVKRGAEDFITKPFERTTVLKKLQNILELQSLRERVAELERTPRHTALVQKTQQQGDDFPLLPLKRLGK